MVTLKRSHHLLIILLGNNVFDLYGGDREISILIKRWQIYNQLSTNNQTSCGGLAVLGAQHALNYGGGYSRTYTSLPAHSTVFYSIRFGMIDQWSSSDYMTISIDSQQVGPIWNTGYYSSTFIQDLDGNTNQRDTFSYIVGQNDHSKSSLTLNITSYISTSSVYFVFREVNILFGTSPMSFSNYSCSILDPYVSGLPFLCGCQTGYYFDPTSSTNCLPCDNRCGQCYGKLNSQCYSCREGSNFNGTHCISCYSQCSRCSGSNQSQCGLCLWGVYMYPNNSCLATACSSPYTLVGWNYKSCETACQMNNTFRLWDGLCNDTCLSPLTQRIDGSLKFCDYPCAQTEYLNYNGSCIESCASVWTQTLHGKKFCNPLCSETVKFFYPDDNTCKSNCPSAFTQTVQDSIVLCENPCSSNQFLYWDGTCHSNCAASLISTLLYGSHYCRYPCTDSSEYFYTDQGICNNLCEYPYKIFMSYPVKLCTLDITQEQIVQVKQYNKVAQMGETATTLTTLISGFLDFANPTAFTTANLARMLQYMKLIQVKYSPKLHYTVQLLNITPTGITFITAMSASARASFPKSNLPKIFESQGFQSNFIVGFWQPFASILIVLAAIGLILILEKTTTKYKKINTVIRQTRIAVKWSFFLTIFCSEFGDLAFYTGLQFLSNDFDSLLSGLAFFICLLTNTVAFLIIILVFHVNINIRNTRKASIEPNENIEKEYERFKVIFQEYRSEYLIQQLFTLMFILRSYFQSFAIVFFYSYPLGQILTMNFLSVIMVVYLLKRRPFKKMINLVQQLVFEGIRLFVNFCLLILCATGFAKK